MKYIEAYTKDEWALELLALDKVANYYLTSHFAYGKVVNGDRILSRAYGPAYSNEYTISQWLLNGLQHRHGLPSTLERHSSSGYIFHSTHMACYITRTAQQ